MTQIEINYWIKERAEETIKKYLSIDKAIETIKQELQEFEDAWSKYSCDCLGHGITCNKLLVLYLQEIKEKAYA